MLVPISLWRGKFYGDLNTRRWTTRREQSCTRFRHYPNPSSYSNLSFQCNPAMKSKNTRHGFTRILGTFYTSLRPSANIHNSVNSWAKRFSP